MKTFHVCIMDNRLLDWYFLRRNYIIVYMEQLVKGFFYIYIEKGILCCSKFVNNNKGLWRIWYISLTIVPSAACPWLFLPNNFFFKYNRVPTEKKNTFWKFDKIFIIHTLKRLKGHHRMKFLLPFYSSK